MGSKAQKQNQHVQRLTKKIERFKKKGRKTEGLEKELAYTLGDTPRPPFATGQAADPRHKKRVYVPSSS